MYISISEEFKSVATINLTPVSIIIITFLCIYMHPHTVHAAGKC